MNTGIMVLLMLNLIATDWEEYKKRLNKTYTNEHDKKYIWLLNQNRIHIHNQQAEKGHHGYTLKSNHLADMSQSEYHEFLGPSIKSKKRKIREVKNRQKDNSERELDWRIKGFQFPSWNQENCNSCYAFTIASSIKAQDNWTIYKKFYNKTYLGDETLKRNAWSTHAKMVAIHNLEAKRGLHGYTLKTNLLADLDIFEYFKLTNFMAPRAKNFIDKRNSSVLKSHRRPRLPRKVDWRKKGFVMPHWDQGKCGSCYAFSIASSLQAQMFIKEGKSEELSTQQIVDCSILNGNLGCGGGSFKSTLRYLKTHGVMKESDYPYEAKQSICRYKPYKIAAKIQSWSFLPEGDEEALKEALANSGPIPVAINARPITFQLYDRGIYDDPNCTNETLNHAVLLVGYTEKAWIVKNWWTESWGQGGYMYIKRGVNMCGISNLAVNIKL